MNTSAATLLGIAIQYEKIARGILYRYSRNNADVDELMQDLYIKLLQYAAQKDAPAIDNMRAFVATLARNIANDFLRHKSVAKVELAGMLESIEVPDPAPSLERELNGRQQVQQVVAALREMPLRSRRVFVLARIYQLSTFEITQRCNITVHTCERHMSRAIHFLDNYLGASRADFINRSTHHD
jgi:RNA polymerase sigma factor (sigma-70 family)